jgi:hypothetical protein
MANVTHASLTGANLHEPKGVATATSGQVYVADGAGSGDWDIPYVAAADVNNLNLITLTRTFNDISTAGSQWVVCPIAGAVTKIWSVIDNAITTANCTLSFEINGTAITSGNITITQAGSNAGDVDSSTPSANNVLTAGQPIEIISDGASDTTCNATITFVIDVS